MQNFCLLTHTLPWNRCEITKQINCSFRYQHEHHCWINSSITIWSGLLCDVFTIM